MFSRISAVALAISFVLLSPVDADPAKGRKPRFKIIERTHVSETFLSLPGINLATSYPDTIEVHGPRESRIADIDLHLYDFSHDMPDHIDILLVAPNGRTALVMSDAGGQPVDRGIDLTLDDDARRQLPRNGSLSTGRYRPANYEENVTQLGLGIRAESAPGSDTTPGENAEPGADGTPGGDGTPGEPGEPGGNPGFIDDDFPLPAPAFDGAFRLSTFHGMEPTGPWQLFIRADGPAAGEITGGWGLTIEVKKRT